MKSSKDAEIIAKASDESRTGLRKWLIDRLRSPHLKRFHNLYLSEQERIEIRPLLPNLWKAQKRPHYLLRPNILSSVC